MRVFILITAVVTLTLLSNIGWSQCSNECTIDFQNDGTFYNPSPFMDVTSNAAIDIVAGASGPTLSGFLSDVFDENSSSCSYATGNGNDFTLDFEIEPFFDVYGGNTIATNATGNDAARYIRHENTGFQGNNATNNVIANSTSTGDVSCYNLSVCFASPQEAQNVSLSTSSINTRGESFESASIIFYDSGCNPYGTAMYNGYWATAPQGSGTGTNTTTPNASSNIYSTTGTGVFIASDIGVIDITDPVNPEAGSDGPRNTGSVLATTDGGLAATDLVGGFSFRVCLEDIATTNVVDERTTTRTSFTSTLNGFDICLDCTIDFTGITVPEANITSESTCEFPSTEPTGGVIEVPTATCPDGSTLEYSIDAGESWSTDLPEYDQDMEMTITTRCVCDSDPTSASAESSVTTNPGACVICDDVDITAEVLCTNSEGMDAAIGEYYIKITNGVSTTHTVTASGSPTSTTAGNDIFFGPITHSTTGTATTTITITQDDKTLCVTEIVLQELVCGYAIDPDGDSDGTVDSELHASGPACGCDAGGDEMAGIIVAQSAPGSFDPATTTMVYVLTDASDVIISSNNAGLYTNLANGTYKVYAYNVTNADLTAFQAGITAGNNISTVDIMAGCVSACTTPAMYTLGCDCACEFSNLMVETSCELDDDGEMLGTYCVDVSFDIDNPLSLNYEVVIAGTVFGPFAYGESTNQTICDPSFLGDLEMGVGVIVRDASSATMMEGIPPLLISEALPNPSGNDAGNETVTILNNTCESVDIGDYEIGDKDGSQFTIPTGTMLVAGATYVHTFSGSELTNTSDNADLITPAGVTVSTLSWTNALDGVPESQAFDEAVCPTANQMCSVETTFDEILCVDPAEICGVQIESMSATCNSEGAYDLQVCFSHMAGLTPYVSIEVDGEVVQENVATNGGLQCVTIASAGTGDGSQNILVRVYEAFVAPVGANTVMISEIHYDNESTDTGEGVEVSGPAGLNLAGYELYFYNGTDARSYLGSPIVLSGIIDDEGSGCGAVFTAIVGIQNGAPDGIALVDPFGSVLQFISYEGSFVAMNGPAAGMTSVDIGVSQNNDPVGTSMQITDLGWVTGVASSYGAINEGLRCPDMDIPEVCEDVTSFDAPNCEVQCGYLACNNSVQVSLGTDCEQCITPDMVLEGTYPIGYENYDVIITDTSADTIVSPAGCVGLKYAGMELMVSVECGGSSCWGTLVIEDKLPPQLTNCAELQADLEDQYGTSLQCSDLNADWDITVSLIDSVIVECNTDFTVTTEQGLTGDMCSDDYRWTKRYVVDFPQAHGNRDTAHACVITLPVTPIGLDDIICPDDQVVGCRDTNFSPESIFDFWSRPQNSTGGGGDTTVAYAITQSFPYIINSAGDTVKLTKEHCNVLSSYTDTELPICQFKRKQLRKWTFIDWCTNQVRTCDQVIKMIDDEAMICTAPAEFDIPLGSHCLIDSTLLPTDVAGAPLVIYSGCGNVVDTTIFYKAKAATREAIDDLPFTLQAIKNGDGTFTIPPIEVPFDSIWFKYEFTNACGESCAAFTEARVIDNTPPTPICNPDIAISFSDLEKGDDGLVKIFADAFDAGSHDNSCGPVYFKIVRQAELNNSTDGYWNNSGPHGGPDYTRPPIANINRFCNSANGDDFGDVTLNGSELVSTGNQFWFDDHIKLCCTDENFNVMMRVFDVDPGDGPVDPRRMHSEPTQIEGTTEVIDNDLFGHFNDCWVELSVQDKTQILGACQSLSLFCDEYPDNPMDNAPEINMLCSDDRVNLFNEDLADISECGNGLVIRQWFARKSNGDTAKVCSQSIVLQARAFDPFSIQWPKQYVDGTETGRRLYQDSLGVCLDSTYQVPMGGALDCSAEQNSCEPAWDGIACNLIGLSSADDTLFVDGDACMKIIRKWSVIDWCIYNENSDADKFNSSDRFEAILDDCEESCDPDNVYFKYTNVEIDGYYTYEQVLKIVDDQAPVLSGCDNKTRGLTDGCTLQLNISKTATDGTGCGQSFLKWIAILQDTSGNTLGTYPGVTDNPGTYEVETRAVPPGVYNVIWVVEDACGNESTCVEQYTVVDAKAPTPLCVRDLSTVLMPSTGSLEIWAADYDLKSEDNCSTPIFSFSADSIQSGLTLTCDDMDGFAAKSFSYQVYVFDEAGNADFCVVTLRVDAKDICGGDGEGGSAAIIQGYISTESGDMVEDAQAMVNAALPEYPVMMMTEDNGEFAFPNNPFAYYYDVLIEKDGDDVNGVSTLDIVLIQKHILGLKSLDSPYKVIAADANNDQRVSASDLVHIRKLILGVNNEFTDNTSWRFVDADQTFQSLYNPWPFVEVINIGNLNSDMMEEDFVGVKVGDVNGNASANSLHQAEVRSSGTLTFQIEDKVVRAGEEFSVDFTADNFNLVLGYQMTLTHTGLTHLESEGKAIKLSDNNVASFDNLLTMSWDNEQAVSTDEVLFTLHFRADKDMALSEVLAINSRKTKAEAYLGASLETYDIALVTTEDGSTISQPGFELYQNQPNPFVTETSISFLLPEANEATITIMDVTGKMIMKISDIYDKGYNEVSIRSDEIQTSGVIYYQLESGKHIATKKMIIMN